MAHYEVNEEQDKVELYFDGVLCYKLSNKIKISEKLFMYNIFLKIISYTK